MAVNSQLHSLKRCCSEYLYYQNLMVSNSLKSVFVWQNDSTINFSVLLKVWSMFTSQQSEFAIKMLLFAFIYFFVIFLLFFIIKFVFLLFLFLLLWSIKFPLQNIDESETRIDGPKLSTELYVSWKVCNALSNVKL